MSTGQRNCLIPLDLPNDFLQQWSSAFPMERSTSHRQHLCNPLAARIPVTSLIFSSGDFEKWPLLIALINYLQHFKTDQTAPRDFNPIPDFIRCADCPVEVQINTQNLNYWQQTTFSDLLSTVPKKAPADSNGPADHSKKPCCNQQDCLSKAGPQHHIVGLLYSMLLFRFFSSNANVLTLQVWMLMECSCE